MKQHSILYIGMGEDSFNGVSQSPLWDDVFQTSLQCGCLSKLSDGIDRIRFGDALAIDKNPHQ